MRREPPGPATLMPVIVVARKAKESYREKPPTTNARGLYPSTWLSTSSWVCRNVSFLGSYSLRGCGSTGCPTTKTARDVNIPVPG